MPKCATRPCLPAFLICGVIVFLNGCFLSTGTPISDKINGETEAAVVEAIPGDVTVFPAVSPGTGETSEMSEAAPDADTVEDNSEPSAGTTREIGPQSSLDAAMDLIETGHEYWTDGDGEKSLEALDQAYGLIVGVDPGSDTKLIQQKEELRFTISRRILEIYAARYMAAKGTHKAIPITINTHVEREIELFKNQERRFFVDAYKRSGKFRYEIIKALKQAGLPEELSWLPLIESGFNVKALSRSRALGLWQFIPSTGYKFGLTRTAWIDERMDPAKATAAAIGYLKELHAIFGEWATVLAAYNCGEGTVLRAIRRQKINYLDNFWDLYERLPNETARYYPRFLAVLAILKDPARYDMVLETPDSPREFEVVPVQKQLHLKTVAESVGVPFAELAALNPELRRHVTPPSLYSLKVPPGKSQGVLARLEALPGWSAPKREYVYHRVRRGETLSLLALKYRTSIRAIEDLNNLRRNHFVRAGQTLRVPLTGS